MISRRLAPFSLPPHEPALARDERRAGGVYYTPPEIARLIAERTLGSLLAPLSPYGRGVAVEGSVPLRILDPACGAGEFLGAARDVLNDQPHELFGIDIDPGAIAATRQRLSLAGTAQQRVRVADALEDSVLPANSFDAIIGNPPYVSIRELARHRSPQEIAKLRDQYRTARGNFDLYVLFIERALQWLKPGGCCGLIVPNKWATLDYARACRELLLDQATIDEVIDLSSHRVFRKASVYPHVLIFRKQPAAPGHAMKVQNRGLHPCGPHALPADRPARLATAATLVQQANLRPDAFVFSDTFRLESQVATRPLGNIVRLQCGTTGYAAARIADSLIEADGAAGCKPADSPALPFITSGNIDRYRIQPGNVRFLGKTWCDPRLPLTAQPLTQRQRTLFAAPKIVIAGMSRRIEAAWDAAGLALGVQVYAATDWQVDPHYLLALLNSKLLTYLFRTRFAAKRLAGGYLAINKGQLAKLPIALDDLNGKPARQLANLPKEFSSRQSQLSVTDEARIDRLVYQLYRLDAVQIAEVEAHFDQMPGLRSAA